jgi:cell division protein FtsB
MAWLRRRKRAVQATTVADYPTDARQSGIGTSREPADPQAVRRKRLRNRVLVSSLYLVFGSGIIAALFGSGGLIDLIRLHGEMREVRGELARQQAVVSGLEERVRSLQDDPLARERIAREKLGLVKPGEVVFLLPKQEEQEAPEGD